MSKILSSFISRTVANISDQNDRDTIIRWFLDSRQILDSDLPKKQKAKELYKHLDSKAVAGGFWRSTVTTLKNYKNSNLPLPLKVALPTALAGLAAFGGQGAGVAAFGGAIGLPVVFLLFLGTAGVTSIVEPFLKGDKVSDPITKLLLTLAVLESKRRISKEIANAMRDTPIAPRKAELSDDIVQMQADFLALSPTEFECHVMALFEAAGYPSGVTQASNDFGLDGWAQLPNGVAVVQCKRYAPDNKVGRPDIQQFKGVLEEQKASYGYFVTTSSFTEHAKQSALLDPLLTLVDINKLCEWQKAGKVLLK